MTATTRYTFGTTIAEPIETVRPRVEAALRTEGFGILTEIDVAATLKAKLDAGEDIAIIDLRTELDVIAVPYGIRGSRWIAAERLDEHQAEIPRDRELVLYCS